MGNKKCLVVASLFEFINAFLKNDISILLDKGYEVFCACNFKKYDTEYIKKLESENVQFIQIDFLRSPFSKQTLVAYQQLKKIIHNNQFDIIHCHTPVGGILTRLAARKARKKETKAIYTAHGFHFYKGAPLLNWLIYYPVEKICAHFTDALITINTEDYALAKKKMKAKQVFYLPGVGVEMDKYENIAVDKLKKREEIGVPQGAVMLLSVGELNKNKNHEVIIRALAKLNNPDYHYCIAGAGPLEAYLVQLADEFNISNNVHLLGYRKDVGELYKTADIFCFPSYREGLSVSLLESMSCALPSVVSNIRGNTDLIVDGKGGFLLNASDANGFAGAIYQLVSNNQLRNEMGRYNLENVKKFDINNTQKIMKDIYNFVLNIE